MTKKKIIIIFLLTIIIAFFAVVYFGLPEKYKGDGVQSKIFFNGRPFMYLTNEDTCIDWCTSFHVVYDGFNVTELNGPGLIGKYPNLETSYASCSLFNDIKYKNKDNGRQDFDIIYKHRKYWYKLTLNNPEVGCQLYGYVLKNAQDHTDYDLSGMKERYFDYDCDNLEHIKIIGRRFYDIRLEVEKKLKADPRYGLPSKQDVCKYIKWQDTKDKTNCSTIGNPILKSYCGR
ncbi:MAG TPA: hypothetical protein PLH37_01070 [bacterium]|nr:hypothetical protein [bacterium]